MRLCFVPPKARGYRCSCEDRLSKRDAANSRGVEATERVERVTLDRRAFHRLVEKTEVEMRVVANQDRTTAAVFAHRAPHLAKSPLQGVTLVNCGPQWMMRIDAIHGQRRWLHVGPLERLHVVTNRLTTAQQSFGIEVQQDSSDLEQCIGRAIEPAGFNVNYNWQKTAEAVCHSDVICHLQFRLEQLLVEDGT